MESNQPKQLHRSKRNADCIAKPSETTGKKPKMVSENAIESPESPKTTTTIKVGEKALFLWTGEAMKKTGNTRGLWKSSELVTSIDASQDGTPQYTIMIGKDDEGTPIYFETGAERLLPCPLKKPSKWIYDHTFVDTPQFGEVYICRSALPYEFEIDNWKPGDLRYDAFTDYPYSGNYRSLMVNKNPLTADEMKNFLQL